jgi:hypothetical protein
MQRVLVIQAALSDEQFPQLASQRKQATKNTKRHQKGKHTENFEAERCPLNTPNNAKGNSLSF